MTNRMMNRQDMFNIAVNGVINQGAFSADGDGYCQYRGLNGNKCAVGQLISDEHYCVGMENVGIIDRTVKNALRDSIGRELDDGEIEMLRSLQRAHDSASEMREHGMETFVSCANKVALDNDLVPVDYTPVAGTMEVSGDYSRASVIL